MLEHDAQASGRAWLSIDARAYATHERTHALTQKYLLSDEICGFVTRAGGLQTFIEGSGQNRARTPDSENLTPSASASRAALVFARHGFAALSKPDNDRSANAQGFTVRTLASERTLAATTPLTHRVSMLNVGIERHHVDDVACAPIARWRGRSDGSNPLRPSTSFSTAGRLEGATEPYRNSTASIDKNDPATRPEIVSRFAHLCENKGAESKTAPAGNRGLTHHSRTREGG